MRKKLQNIQEESLSSDLKNCKVKPVLNGISSTQSIFLLKSDFRLIQNIKYSLATKSFCGYLSESELYWTRDRRGRPR
jgi:hypothetical protein